MESNSNTILPQHGTSGNLLMNEYPLVILPSLAEAIGLHEAIILQQLHYWLLTYQRNPEHIKEGRVWVYNTYEDWQKQFPFMSIRNLKRIISGMESQGYLLTGNFNKMAIDRTTWYSIDYEAMNKLMARPLCQLGTMDSAKLALPITRDYFPETTTNQDNNNHKVEENHFEENELDEEKKYHELCHETLRELTGSSGKTAENILNEFINGYGARDTLTAMRRAVLQGKPILAYVKAILENGINNPKPEKNGEPQKKDLSAGLGTEAGRIHRPSPSREATNEELRRSVERYGGA